MSIKEFKGLLTLGWICIALPLSVSAEVDTAGYQAKAEQALEQGRYRTAVTYYTRIVRALPEDISYRLSLGQTQLLRGKVAQAREQAEVILSRDANHRQGLILMSKAVLRTQAWEEANGYLQTLLQHYPDEPYGYLGLASVYSSRDDDTAAEAAMGHYRTLQNTKASDDGQ